MFFPMEQTNRKRGDSPDMSHSHHSDSPFNLIPYFVFGKLHIETNLTVLAHSVILTNLPISYSDDSPSMHRVPRPGGARKHSVKCFIPGSRGRSLLRREKKRN